MINSFYNTKQAYFLLFDLFRFNRRNTIFTIEVNKNKVIYIKELLDIISIIVGFY